MLIELALLLLKELLTLLETLPLLMGLLEELPPPEQADNTSIAMAIDTNAVMLVVNLIAVFNRMILFLPYDEMTHMLVGIFRCQRDERRAASHAMCHACVICVAVTKQIDT